MAGEEDALDAAEFFQPVGSDEEGGSDRRAAGRWADWLLSSSSADQANPESKARHLARHRNLLWILSGISQVK